MQKDVTNRYTALDVLRGMTIAGMILVNNPGSWGSVFPPLRHAAWSGCTPTDLVFPFFLFIVGAALSFAFAKYNDSLNSSSLKKIVKRAFFIFLTGLALNAFPFYPTSPNPDLTFGANYLDYLNHLRIFGVLQRIALCYLLGGILALWLQKPKKIIVGMVILMVVHWLILLIFGADGGPYSIQGNIAGPIDVAVAGNSHVYHGFGVPFDPEGLLGVLSGSATVLLGYLIGGIIRKSQQKIDAVGQLYTIGLISLAIAVILNIFIPINKPMWTPSYVFYAGGWAILILAFFIYLIDIKKKEKYFFPFKALGLNPLFAFVMAGIFARLLGRVIKWSTVVVKEDGSTKEVMTNASSWAYQHLCVPVLGNNEWGSLMYAICYVAIFTAMAIYLYKKKIVIKL